jgi:ABC-type phosphate/phosphonate transport system substrate-binding protein
MTDFFAALPMYDWPEARAEVDAEWAAIRSRLRAAGIDAPEKLVRRNADMPPVPGGIRDAAGAIVAPDPATLPPDELDFSTLWHHPKLLFGQTCWGPLELELVSNVRIVGQPDYSAYEGGQGELYSSAILMRRNPPALSGGWPEGPDGAGWGSGLRQETAERGRDDPAPPLRGDPHLEGEGDVGAPSDGTATIPLGRIRGKRLAFNSHDSMSGILALTRDLAALGEGLDVFSGLVETGAHRASVMAVAEGRADVAAVDCRSWQLIRRFEPKAGAVRVVGWTGRRKGLPYIAALGSPVTELPR